MRFLTSWLSPTDSSLILYFGVDVKSLFERGKDFPWPRPASCPTPGCGSRRLWGHGYVRRYFEEYFQPFWVKRYRCPECEAVHTLRPRTFYKRFWYSALTILVSLLNKIIYGRWLRCLSRQVQQYWFKGFLFQCSRRSTTRSPPLEALRRLLLLKLIPVTHSTECEILAL